jgi:hypothetical protein
MIPLAYENLKFLYKWNLARFGANSRNLKLKFELEFEFVLGFYSDTRGVIVRKTNRFL